jgi:hypothetical protein
VRPTVSIEKIIVRLERIRKIERIRKKVRIRHLDKVYIMNKTGLIDIIDIKLSKRMEIERNE